MTDRLISFRKSGLLLLICLISATLTVSAQNKVYTVDNLPKTHVQDYRRYVTDPDGILSESTRDSIDSWFYALEQQKGIESVIAVVNSIGEEDCFNFCHELMNSWGVGKADLDNGFVMLLVTDQRCIQFYTGYGIEGILPDAICKRIQVQQMVPSFKEGDWDSGMFLGCKITADYLMNGSSDYISEEDEEDEEGIWALIGFVLFTAAGGLGLGWLASWKNSRCPSCKKHSLQKVYQALVKKTSDVKVYEVTYICSHCGHVHRRRESVYSSESSGRAIGGGVGGGGFGGSFGGGGGGFGGSFGGGHGGGGGAGTHF